MTVADLIERLKLMNQDDTVTLVRVISKRFQQPPRRRVCREMQDGVTTVSVGNVRHVALYAGPVIDRSPL